MGAADPRVGGLMQFTTDESATLLRILRWRRDVRHFRPDPVDEAVLERLRATMDCAPSVGNARPWRVIRVDDPALRPRCAPISALQCRGRQALHAAKSTPNIWH